MNEAIKPTPGLWHTQPPNPDDDEHSSDRRRYTWRVRTVYEPDGNTCIGHEVCEISHLNTGHEESDARLIAEAGNVFHDTGLTPRQLVEQRDALAAALVLMVRTHDEPAESLLQEARELKWLSQARAALAMVKGEKP